LIFISTWYYNLTLPLHDKPKKHGHKKKHKLAPPAPVVARANLTDLGPLFHDHEQWCPSLLFGEAPPSAAGTSYVCRRLPWMAQLDPRLAEKTSHIVQMRQVLWTGQRWRLFSGAGGKAAEDILLTTRQIASFYYQKKMKASWNPVVAEVVADDFVPDSGLCPGGYIEEATVVTSESWCENHWHAAHDIVMPIMATFGDRGPYQAMADNWDPVETRVVFEKDKNRGRCNESVPISGSLAALTSHPTMLYTEIANGTCFKRIQFGTSQRLNMYGDKKGAGVCVDFRAWQRRFLAGLGIQRSPPRTDGRLRTIWVARTGGEDGEGGRSVVNRAEVLARINEEFGSTVHVQEVFLEHLTFIKQIQTFVDSDIVMGPHGAGLAKIMFMQPKSALLQIVPFGMGDGIPCIWEMPDGSKFYKGGNFVTVAKCAQVHYVQYNTSWEESYMSRAMLSNWSLPYMPNGSKPLRATVSDPSKHWGYCRDLHAAMCNNKGEHQCGPKVSRSANGDYLLFQRSNMELNIEGVLADFRRVLAKVNLHYND
jgi:hypothetical protein